MRRVDILENEGFVERPQSWAPLRGSLRSMRVDAPYYLDGGVPKKVPKWKGKDSVEIGH